MRSASLLTLAPPVAAALGTLVAVGALRVGELQLPASVLLLSGDEVLRLRELLVGRGRLVAAL